LQIGSRSLSQSIFRPLTSEKSCLKESVCPRALGVDHPLRDPFSVEMGHLIEEHNVLQQGWALLSGSQRVGFVPNGRPIGHGQGLTGHHLQAENRNRNCNNLCTYVVSMYSMYGRYVHKCLTFSFWGEILEMEMKNTILVFLKPSS
jgi:hypothetical protein